MKDRTGKTVLDKEGKPVITEVFNFGKYKGQPVSQVLRYDQVITVGYWQVISLITPNKFSHVFVFVRVK